MKDKLAQFAKVPYGVFLILFVLSLGLSMYALRSNNQEMLSLRSEVYAADEKNGDVETALKELREYVHAHMNTNLASGGNAIKPPLQLKYTYERLVAAEQAMVDEVNSNIYTEAQEVCQAQNPSSFSGGPRVPCVEEYVTTHGGASAKEIPEGLYKFDFVSPTWSPDLAGWSVILTAVLFVVFLASFLQEQMVKARIKSHEI